MPIINRVAEFQDELAAWRRDLHAHPETAYEEVETAGFVAAKLREFGVDEVHTGLARTGVVGVLRGGEGDGRIGIRADMDALPIQEQSGKPWASTVPGKMHACGHDGHTTMLLGAARYLAETRNFSGTVYLIFQPAEEGFAGALKMIEDGLFERFPAERVFGMHNWPDLPVGQFGIRVGPAMAAADRFSIEVHGHGCHGAMPHQGKDPVIAAAMLVQAFQPLVAREVPATEQAVISVTKIHGGDAFNVVPDRVQMAGTVRTYSAAVQAMLERRMREIAQGIALTQNVDVQFCYERGYPATVNPEPEVRLSGEVAGTVVGDPQVHMDYPPSMGAEDFAYMLERKPGSYILLGNGGGEDGRVCHSPTYDFNDEALPYGVSYWARLVETLLPRG